MPFVRFSRDRRGYEHTYLIHAAPRRGAPTRILYWYRTPPGIKVGREAFDLEARRMLEAQYPSVTFDWPKLLDTPMPPPETENWRERRRVERSARQARQADEPEEVIVEAAEIGETRSESMPEPAVEPLPLPAVAEAAGETGATAAESPSKKRRRRGGRRRRRQDGAIAAGGPAEHPSDEDGDALADEATPGLETISAEPPSLASASATESTGNPAADISSKAPE